MMGEKLGLKERAYSPPLALWRASENRLAVFFAFAANNCRTIAAALSITESTGYLEILKLSRTAKFALTAAACRRKQPILESPA